MALAFAGAALANAERLASTWWRWIFHHVWGHDRRWSTYPGSIRIISRDARVASRDGLHRPGRSDGHRLWSRPSLCAHNHCSIEQWLGRSAGPEHVVGSSARARLAFTQWRCARPCGRSHRARTVDLTIRRLYRVIATVVCAGGMAICGASLAFGAP